MSDTGTPGVAVAVYENGVMGNKFRTVKTAGQSIATFGAALFTELTGIKGKGDSED